MIGTLIFADIPLATAEGDDVLWGWIDQCPESNNWNKVPGSGDNWMAQSASSQIWNKSPAVNSDWQKQSARDTSWSKQDRRVDDHKKC